MADMDFYIERARALQYQGMSENKIKELLGEEDLNEYQVSIILSKLNPPKVSGKEDDYIQLRHGTKLRRWHIGLIMRGVAFLIGIAFILGILSAVLLKGANIGDFVFMLVLAGGLLLFSSGVLD